MDPGSATIVVETFNLAEGQSLDSLRDALSAACIAAREGKGSGHSVMLVDPSGGDPRVAQLLASLDGPVRYVPTPVDARYDGSKDMASQLAASEFVVYLDGDCVPVYSAGQWLDAMLEPLRTTDAAGAGGITVYRGKSFVYLACTVMDFGYLADHADGDVPTALGCYASNNAAFRRDWRATTPAARPPVRCACYSHTQFAARNGSSIVLAASPYSMVDHELPPFFRERVRRGRDAVRAVRIDPLAEEAEFFSRPDGRMVRGVLDFYSAVVETDRRHLETFSAWMGSSQRTQTIARLSFPVFRLIDAFGVALELTNETLRPWRSRFRLRHRVRSALRRVRSQPPSSSNDRTV
jgi:hypothetical protein